MTRRMRALVAPLIAVALLVTASAALVGCSVRADDIANAAKQRMSKAKKVIGEELESHIARATKALDEIEEALIDAHSPEGQGKALLALKNRHDISGLLWEGPGSETSWIGDPVTPRNLPAEQPWQRSFRSGDVVMHIGPYLRALIVGPRNVLGGKAYATVVLEREGPGDSAFDAFGQRWAQPLQLSEVQIVRPAGNEVLPEGPYADETEVRAPNGTIALRVQVRAHDPEAIEEQLEEQSDRSRGIAMLVGLALALILIVQFGIRRLKSRPARWLVGAALALVTREVLRRFEMHLWFPNLHEVFSPSEFALDTPLGWLSSPADFVLTSVAYLIVVSCIAIVLRRVRLPRGPLARTVLIFGGPAIAAAAATGWQVLVQAAVRGSGTPFFRADSFFPGAPATLMLVSLVITTATAYLMAQTAMRLSRRAFGIRNDWAIRILIGAAGAAGAWYLGLLFETTHWVAIVMPFLAALFAGRDERSGLAGPSRILLISVIATALAYPVLWSQVAERDGESLSRHLTDLLGAEASSKTRVAFSLIEAQGDIYLKLALRAASRAPRGVPAEGLAFHAWLNSDFQDGSMPIMVSVLDPVGGMIDQFSLTGISTRLLPHPDPADSEQARVSVAIGEPGRLRCVVGRAQILDDDGALLGHVVFTVPDSMDIELNGYSESLITNDRLFERPLTSGQKTQFAKIRAGRGQVVATSSPSVSRSPGGFGPRELADVGPNRPSFPWITDKYQGSAVWNQARGFTFAVRKALPGFGEAMLAMARVVLVGVGLGVVVAIIWLLFSLPTFRLRLQHKIFLSYFLISVIPLVLLGVASANDARQRFERRLEDRLDNDLSRMRREIEKVVGSGWQPKPSDLQEHALGHDLLLYRDGRLTIQSRPGLKTAELVPPRLPAEAFKATVLEKRRLIQRDAQYAGRPVWFGYEPVLDSTDRTRWTIGIPLQYDRDRMNEEVTISGNVLLAAYLLTLVLVLVGGIYAANNIARPIGLLARGTRRIARGDLDVELPESGSDELAQLVANFNAMTRELRDTTERAVSAEREMAWRKMARQVAHEIKNPLTPMRLMIQQLEADVARDPSQAREAIQRTSQVVLRQIDGLSRIAGDFANFARLPNRKLTDVAIGALVEEVGELYRGSAAEGIAVHCEVEPDLPAVHWDMEELRRVLINLVRNGIQAIDQEGQVLMRAFRRDHAGERGVAVTVTDTGAGISAEDHKRLFEPHFSTKTSGMGLGLAIVNRIVTDSGGSISVESSLGKGASFTIWWPTDRNRQTTASG